MIRHPERSEGAAVSRLPRSRSFALLRMTNEYEGIEQTPMSIAEKFVSMEYGPAPEDSKEAVRLAGTPCLPLPDISSAAVGRRPRRASISTPSILRTARNSRRWRKDRRQTLTLRSKPRGLRLLDGRRSLLMPARATCMPSRGWCRSIPGCSRFLRPWTTASPSARVATLIFRWWRGISITMPAGRNFWNTNSPSTYPAEWSVRSFPGISRC